MTTYYVGSGGNDGNAGTSWALRKLTLNGAEDIPVVANDTVYVAPGVYRETLTVDVSGSSGQPITYIADVTGENTDGVGGVVRVTGSDDDQSGTRSYCVTASGKTYRTFRGFTFDLATNTGVWAGSSCTDWYIEDCTFGPVEGADYAIHFSGSYTNCVVRRCMFMGGYTGVRFYNGSDQAASGCSVEDCLFIGAGRAGYGVECNNVDSVTIKNCTMWGCYRGVQTQSLATSTSITVNNCIVANCYTGMGAQTSGEISEDYNAFFANNSDRSNVTPGGNSNAYPLLPLETVLLSGWRFPLPWWALFMPSHWSSLAAITGSSETSSDLMGITKPTTASKSSWGAIQHVPVVRDTATTYNSSTAALELSDAGSVQFRIPVTNASTTISVRVYREANYAGTNPRMVIKQPGQSDRTTTDAGSSGAFNELTDTFTPAASPGYVIVELQSLNTATSGSYAVYFDSLAVS